MKRSIMIFLNAFWNYGREISGGDQVLIQVFKRIRHYFSAVYCYTSEDGRTIIENEVEALKYIISPRWFDRLSLLISYVLRTLKTLGSLRVRSIDIIYVGSDFFPDVIPATLYKALNPKAKWIQCIFHIYPEWRTRPGSKVRNFVGFYLQRFSFLLAKRADVVIILNSQIREDLIKMGFDRKRLFINPPGIDYWYLKDLRTLPDTATYDGTFLARLNPSKGIFDLIEIWGRVVQQLPAARLAVIGGGSAETTARLNAIIAESGLETKIDVLGFLEKAKAFSIIKKSKVFLFPSHEEGFGIAVAEAMACGTPVVSWDLAVYSDVFGDYTIRVPDNDFSAFANAVVQLLLTETKTRSVARRAQDFVKEYDWDSIANKHLDILL